MIRPGLLCRMAAAFVFGLLAGATAKPQDACITGDQALATARWSAANDAYQLCVKTNPGFAVYSNMGVVLSHMGLMQEAIDSYSKALALDPTNSKIEFNLSVALIKEDSYALAVDHLKHLERTGEDVRYDELLAFSYYHLGTFSLAARAAERVYASRPEDPANALILGSTYERLGLYEKALPLITLALKAAGSAEGHLMLAQILNGLHRYTEAENELQQLAADQPDFAGIHEALGEVYVGTERSAQAEVEFAAAINQDPNDFEANYMLGRLKRFDGDFVSADRYLTIADRLHPNSSEVQYERAEMAIKERHFADAIPLLEAVIKADPDQPQAYLLLSTAYRRTGRTGDAQREGELYDAKRREAQERMAAPNKQPIAREGP